MTTEPLLEHLEALSKELNYAKLIQSRKKHACRLLLGDTREVDLFIQEDIYIFSAMLCEITPPLKEELLASLLTANLAGKATEGAALGINKEETMFTLTNRLPKSRSYEECKAFIEGFVNAYDFWQEEIKQLQIKDSK